MVSIPGFSTEVSLWKINESGVVCQEMVTAENIYVALFSVLSYVRDGAPKRVHKQIFRSVKGLSLKWCNLLNLTDLPEREF